MYLSLWQLRSTDKVSHILRAMDRCFRDIDFKSNINYLARHKWKQEINYFCFSLIRLTPDWIFLPSEVSPLKTILNPEVSDCIQIRSVLGSDRYLDGGLDLGLTSPLWLVSVGFLCPATANEAEDAGTAEENQMESLTLPHCKRKVSEWIHVILTAHSF